MAATKEAKFGTKVAYGIRMMPELRIHAHSTENGCDTTLDDGNALQHVTCVLVMALCDHPEAFASNLGNDQSRYLFPISDVNRTQTPRSQSVDLIPLIEIFEI